MISQGYLSALSVGDSFVVSGGKGVVRPCGRAWLGAEEDVDRRWGRALCRRAYIVHTMFAGVYRRVYLIVHVCTMMCTCVYNITPTTSALPQPIL